jgi:hypothetical protein
MASSGPGSDEKIARNNDTFRRANEAIRDAAEEHRFAAPVPFICECPEPTCRELVRVALEAYEEVRRHPRRFLTVPEHADREGGDVVSTSDGYVVVEKHGRAGEIAAELDPRGGEG